MSLKNKIPPLGTNEYRAWNRARYRANAEQICARAREKRVQNPDAVRLKEAAYAREYRAKLSAEQKSEANRRYYLNTRDKRKADKRNKRYGLAAGEFEQMLSAQEGCCAICRRPQGEETCGTLCVDHCHKTGIVRGLLCRDCNVALGFIERSQPVLAQMIKYLGCTKQVIRSDRETK